jgi:hypothetical protein
MVIFPLRIAVRRLLLPSKKPQDLPPLYFPDVCQRCDRTDLRWLRHECGGMKDSRLMPVRLGWLALLLKVGGETRSWVIG